MGVIAWIILGPVAGAIAKALLPGRDPQGLIVTGLIAYHLTTTRGSGRGPRNGRRSGPGQYGASPSRPSPSTAPPSARASRNHLCVVRTFTS